MKIDRIRFITALYAFCALQINLQSLRKSLYWLSGANHANHKYPSHII